MITYDEARHWSYWLRIFTKSDLANAMGVHPDAVDGFIIGLQRNGTVEDTGDRVNGTGPEEAILALVPLPPGPTHHFTRDPEWKTAPGVGELAPRHRGEAVRIRSDREYRRAGSKPGEGHRMRQREKRYKKMMEAREAAKLAAQAKMRAEPGFRPKAGKNRWRSDE